MIANFALSASAAAAKREPRVLIRPKVLREAVDISISASPRLRRQPLVIVVGGDGRAGDYHFRSYDRRHAGAGGSPPREARDIPARIFIAHRHRHRPCGGAEIMDTLFSAPIFDMLVLRLVIASQGQHT